MKEWYWSASEKPWRVGEWTTEPDKVHWIDEKTGYDCLIHRNAGVGQLCGYVGVKESHPCYEKHYDEVDVSVHGGLTFSNHCQETNDPAHGICHEGNEKVWWLGFDCAHLGDAYPQDLSQYHKDFPQLTELLQRFPLTPKEEYRNIAYVKEECTHLAKQLKEIENGKFHSASDQ